MGSETFKTKLLCFGEKELSSLEVTPISCTRALFFGGGGGTIADGSTATCFEVAISHTGEAEEDVGGIAKDVRIAKSQNVCWSKKQKIKDLYLPEPQGQ